MNWKKERQNHIYSRAMKVTRKYPLLRELSPKQTKEIFDKAKNENYYYRHLI